MRKTKQILIVFIFILASAGCALAGYLNGLGPTTPGIGSISVPSSVRPPTTTSWLFDGVNEEIIHGVDDWATDRNDAGTWVFWSKVTTGLFESVAFLIMGSFDSVAGRGYSMFWTEGRFGFFMSNAGGTAMNVKTTSQAFLDDTWYFIAITKNTTRDASGLKFHSNRTGSFALEPKIGTSTLIDTSTISGVASQMASGVSGGESAAFLPGNITNLAHWSGTELSLAQLTTLYGDGNLVDYRVASGVPIPTNYYLMGGDPADDPTTVLTDVVGTADGTPGNMEAGDQVDDVPP